MVQSRTQGQWVSDCTYYMNLSSSAGSNIVCSEKKITRGAKSARNKYGGWFSKFVFGEFEFVASKLERDNNKLTGLHDSRAIVLAILTILISRVYLRDLPLLYDIRGGSLNISLSNGCFSIKCQCFMRICLTFGTAGWYCVTKGKIFLFCLGFGWRACFLFSKITSERVLWTRPSR